LAEEVNDKHLGPWAAMCSADKVLNTPLTPYLTAEILKKTYTYLDGTKLAATGFKYSVPKLSTSTLRQVHIFIFILFNRILCPRLGAE